MTGTTTNEEATALFSNRTLLRITATIGLLALLSAAIAIVGKHVGQTLVRGDNTESMEIRQIVIGQDVLSLPDNMIRFSSQRRTGQAGIVNIFLSWPSMHGYSRQEAATFSTPSRKNSLIFVDFAQSVMSRDMSGRVEPIYSKLFEGTAEPGPAGLTIHRLNEKSGFNGERLLTRQLADGSTYAVRCILPSAPEAATAADCQRDIHVGRDLTMLYRFSSRLLDDWQLIDKAMVTFAKTHIQP